MDTPTVYRSTSGHRFTAEAVSLKEVVTASDTESISPGQLVHDQEGNPFTILEIRSLPSQLWRVMLLPVATGGNFKGRNSSL